MQLQAVLCTYMIFKIKRKLYTASGSAGPSEKFWVDTCLAYLTKHFTQNPRGTTAEWQNRNFSTTNTLQYSVQWWGGALRMINCVRVEKGGPGTGVKHAISVSGQPDTERRFEFKIRTWRGGVDKNLSRTISVNLEGDGRDLL
jgi:hypothetical protein